MGNILGLDVSTRCVGYAKIQNSMDINRHELQNAGFCDISKIERWTDKIRTTLDSMNFLDVNLIIIENTLLNFAYGKSNKQTLITLIKFHTLFSYFITAMNIPVYTIHPSAARKIVFGDVKKPYDASVKEFVKYNIDRMFDMTKYVKFNTHNELDVKNYDMYDAIVVALSGINLSPMHTEIRF